MNYRANISTLHSLVIKAGNMKRELTAMAFTGSLMIEAIANLEEFQNKVDEVRNILEKENK